MQPAILPSICQTNSNRNGPQKEQPAGVCFQIKNREHTSVEKRSKLNFIVFDMLFILNKLHLNMAVF
jgi:hypothetical protein